MSRKRSNTTPGEFLVDIPRNKVPRRWKQSEIQGSSLETLPNPPQLAANNHFLNAYLGSGYNPRGLGSINASNPIFCVPQAPLQHNNHLELSSVSGLMTPYSPRAESSLGNTDLRSMQRFETISGFTSFSESSYDQEMVLDDDFTANTVTPIQPPPNFDFLLDSKSGITREKKIIADLI